MQQNAFSEWDFNCPLVKSIGMLRCIVILYTRCLKAVAGTAGSDGKPITWNFIKSTAGKTIHKVTEMKVKAAAPPHTCMAHVTHTQRTCAH